MLSNTAFTRVYAMRLFTAVHLAIFTAMTGGPAKAQLPVWTYHYDNVRSGANTQETILTPDTVNPDTFGKLFSQATDGQVYAQPLYLPGVAIPSVGSRNVVFVCTMHDSVYAFDADSAAGASATPFWKAAFAPGLLPDGTGVIPIPAGDVGSGFGDIQGEIGITSTPVIDIPTGTIYVLVRTKEITSNGTGLTAAYVQRLHALDIATGAEKFGGPAVIAASVPGNGYNGAYGGFQDAVGGTVPFHPRNELQRAGLLLLNGMVYISWAAHEDKDPYHGWMMGYRASDLSQPPVVYCATPNGGRGGIWQGGMAPAADAVGNIYLMTGNGSVNPAAGNFGDAVLKLSTAAGLSVADYFIPSNQAILDQFDVDLGCSGPMLLPDQPGPFPHLMVGVGKEGIIYLINRDSVGGYNTTDNVVQKLVGFTNGWGPRGAPAYWNGRIYYVGFNDGLKMWTLTNGLLSDQPGSVSQDVYGYLGATPTISANGNTGGIAWAVEIGAYASSGPAILRAYDATDLTRQLYASNKTSGRDTLGPAIKFTAPVVADGKVFVGHGTGISVFGLFPSTTPPAIVSVEATDYRTVNVTYNHPIDPITGTDPSNYAIDSGVGILGVTLSANGRTATLRTTDLFSGKTYHLSVSGVLDRASPPNQIADGSGRDFTFFTLAGDGLAGEYFANTRDLSGSPVLSRIDPVVDFDWGEGAPAPEVGVNNFSVRWTGYVQAPTTETYTFSATADDGVRLFVNGQSLLPAGAWSDHRPTEFSGSVALVAGQLTPIRMEMYENGGGAVARLAWSSPTVSKEIIPQQNLYSRQPAFTMDDVRLALGVSVGAVSADAATLARLNLETAGGSGAALDIADATRLLRQVAGLEANP